MTETALLLLGFNRPDNLRARLDEISKNEITSLIISIDGGGSPDSSSQIIKIIDEFNARNPKFASKTIFRKKNLGLAKHITTAISEVFENFEYCIVVEDDISISENFVKNMLIGQDVFDKSSALTLGGFSPISKNCLMRYVKNRFRETIYFSAWGWMTSAEKWKVYQLEIDLNSISSTLSNSESWRNLNSYKKTTWNRRFLKVSKQNPSTWDFQMQYVTFSKNLIHLLPIYKFCDNVGFNDLLSTHTSGRRPRWMGVEGKMDSSQITVKSLLKKDSILGRILIFLDSIYIAGDSKIVQAHRLFKEKWH